MRSLLPSKPVSHVPNTIVVEDNNISDPNIMVDNFNVHFANIGKVLATRPNCTNNNDFLSYLKSPCPFSVYLYPTSPQEIIKLINKLKLNKACGYDDISSFILKIAAQVLALPLSIMINHCITLGTFPTRLKLAKVIPVYKSGPSVDIQNYRPISLLSSLSKIFERVILNRLVSFLERNSLIIPTQFGFRHNHSTIHSILDIITESYQNIEDKRFSALILLDIKKAFDSVCHKILIKKLEFYGIRGVANKLLHSYLQNRLQFVSINNVKSNLEPVTCGVPQGSILGPLLFLLYINDLPVSLKTMPRLFADDTALLIHESSFSKMESLANSELSNISKWMIANRLTLHPNKTYALNVSPFFRNRTTPELALSLDNVKIKNPSVTKYLGILLDNNLSFKPQIARLESKMSRSVGVIAKLRYYLPSYTLLNLYFALVHSNLLYGLLVWGSTYKSYLTKLKKLQNKALKIITNSCPRERVTPLYHKLKILKLDDLYLFELAKLMYQFTHN